MTTTSVDVNLSTTNQTKPAGAQRPSILVMMSLLSTEYRQSFSGRTRAKLQLNSDLSDRTLIAITACRGSLAISEELAGPPAFPSAYFNLAQPSKDGWHFKAENPHHPDLMVRISSAET